MKSGGSTGPVARINAGHGDLGGQGAPPPLVTTSTVVSVISVCIEKGNCQLRGLCFSCQLNKVWSFVDSLIVLIQLGLWVQFVVTHVLICAGLLRSKPSDVHFLCNWLSGSHVAACTNFTFTNTFLQTTPSHAYACCSFSWAQAQAVYHMWKKVIIYDD
jgi:hypothetical protein